MNPRGVQCALVTSRRTPSATEPSPVQLSVPSVSSLRPVSSEQQLQWLKQLYGFSFQPSGAWNAFIVMYLLPSRHRRAFIAWCSAAFIPDAWQLAVKRHVQSGPSVFCLFVHHVDEREKRHFLYSSCRIINTKTFKNEQQLPLVFLYTNKSVILFYFFCLFMIPLILSCFILHFYMILATFCFFSFPWIKICLYNVFICSIYHFRLLLVKQNSYEML